MSPESIEGNYPPTVSKGRKATVEVRIPGALLSRDQIIAHIQRGNIVINPFEEKNVGGDSVDVRLGEWLWREKVSVPSGIFGNAVNLWGDDASEKLWSGPSKAPTVREFLSGLYGGTEDFPSLEGANITFDDQIMVLQPGENILTHTQEFIGGNQRIGTAMQARSSLGRSHITVCRCAGWGDPGYINRWTMEVTNNSKNNPVILVVGRRVAQIVFYEVDPVSESYGRSGKYQSGVDVVEIMENWRPEEMLPRLYSDREVGELTRRLAGEEDRGTHYAFPPQQEARGGKRISRGAIDELYNFVHPGLSPGELNRFLRETIAAGGLAEIVVEI